MCQIEYLLPAAGCMLAARVPAVLSPSEAVTLYGISCSSCPSGSSDHDSSQQPGRRPSHDCARRADYSHIQQSLMQAISFRRGDAAESDALLVQANALLARADTAYTTEWDVQEQASLDATLGRYPADRHPPLERYVRAAASLPKK